MEEPTVTHISPEEAVRRIDPALPAYRMLVTGPRDYTDRAQVEHYLQVVLNWTLFRRRHLIVVHGDCPSGVDMFTDQWAVRMRNQGFPVEPEKHPAQRHPSQDFGPWPGAGPIRNRYMASLGADQCCAFIGLCSRPNCSKSPHASHGTHSCIRCAESYGIPVKRFYSEEAAQALQGQSK